MTAKLIAPAQVQPITLTEAKAHIRISSDDEDDLISDLINAATEMLERETGLALISQSWRLWIDVISIDGIIRIPRHPVQQVQKIIWYNEAGSMQVLKPGAYFLNQLTRPARLRLDRQECPLGKCNGIEVDFDAGFGNTGADVPDTLRRALLVLVAHWYEFRGVYSAEDQPVSVPEIYTRLIHHYRPVRL